MVEQRRQSNKEAFAGRAPDEVIARIEARKEADLGFEWPIYLEVLTFEQARPFLKPEATGDDWPTPKGLAQLREDAIKYMAFAWEKANNCRGISANRSIMHYQAWLWLLGETWGDSLFDDYEFYGKPQLVRICEYFGLDPKQWDDGIRSNTELLKMPTRQERKLVSNTKLAEHDCNWCGANCHARIVKKQARKEIEAKCENCGGTKKWCPVCRVWSRTCCVEYGTCQCS